MNVPRWKRFLAAALTGMLMAVLWLPAILTADDDEIVTSPAAEAASHEAANIRVNFDQWLFQGVNNAEAGRLRIETRATMHLAEIDRACRLTEAQREKLRLALRGDVQRFFDEVDKLRAKFEAAQGDQQVVNNMWQEIQPLQVRQAAGLTGAGSLLMKVLPLTLDARQSPAYEAVLEERRRFRYRASIAVALHNLEGSIALKHEQRQAIADWLQSLPPPRSYGRYDYYLILYRLDTLPAGKLKSLLDERQVAALAQPLAQARAMRARMLQEGYVTEDFEPPAGAKP